MDETDQQLVQALLADARTSYAQLARLVGLSAPSVQERIRRLERCGIITGYHAAIDQTLAGLAVTALVGVSETESAELAHVADQLSALAEVEDCFFVAGDNAFVVKVRVPDVAALESTIGRLHRVDGVALTRTTVVLSTKWEHRQVPLPLAPPLRSAPSTRAAVGTSQDLEPEEGA